MSKTAVQKDQLRFQFERAATSLGGEAWAPQARGAWAPQAQLCPWYSTSQKCELKVKQTSSKNMDCSLFWLQMIMQHLLGQFVHFCVHHKSSRYVLHIIK